MRREEAVDFVEDDEGAQALAAGERADVGEQVFEDDSEDEGALVVVDVRDAEDDGGVEAGSASRPSNRSKSDTAAEREARASAPSERLGETQSKK